MKIKTPYNAKEFKDYGEKNSLPSMTIPNQAMSIPEMIRRYASGLPLGGARVPFYDENPEEDLLGGKNWNTLDLSEQNDLIKHYKQEYEETVKRLRNTPEQTNNSEQNVNEINTP
jgi:hypothetical protein